MASRLAGQLGESSDPKARRVAPPDDDDEDRAAVPTHPGATPRFAAPSLPPISATPATTGRLGPSRSARDRFGGSQGPAPLDAVGPIGLNPRKRGDDLDLDEPETVLEDRAGRPRRIGPKRDDYDDPATVVAGAANRRAPSDPLRLGLARGATPSSGLRTPAPAPRGASQPADRADRDRGRTRERDRDRDRDPRSASASPGRARTSKPPASSSGDDPETVQLSRMRMSFIGGAVMDPATVQDQRIASELWRRENGGVDEVPPGRMPSAIHDRSNTTLSRFEHEPSEPGERSVSSRVFVPLIVGGLGGGVLVLILLALVAGTLAM